MELFEVKVGYTDDASQEAKKHVCLVDAMSFTEAEAKAIEATQPYTAGGVEIMAEKKVKVDELVNSGDDIADKWYRGRVAFITMDDDKEKRAYSTYLVKATVFGQAYELLSGDLRDSISDWEIVSVAETQIFELVR